MLRLEGFRNERDAIRQLELLVQERSRDQLAEARREVDKQANWAAEVRECLERADADGIARSVLLGPDGKLVDPDEQPGDDEVVDTRVLIYRLQVRPRRLGPTTSATNPHPRHSSPNSQP